MPRIEGSLWLGSDLQPKPSSASRRRQSCALFGYDSCACNTAVLELMPDDARRPARLQGRDAAEDARTTHPCIRRWLGMLAKGHWEYSTMGKMGFNAYPDTTGRFFAGGSLYRSTARRTDVVRRGYKCSGERSPVRLHDLGSPDLSRDVRSDTGYVTYASLDRVAAHRLGSQPPRLQVPRGQRLRVCRGSG